MKILSIAVIAFGLASCVLNKTRYDAFDCNVAYQSCWEAFVADIRRAWHLPEGLPADLKTKVEIRFKADGTIEELNIIESSGNLKFDQSVMNAINKVAPLSFYSQLTEANFNQFYRHFRMTFDPYR